MSKSILLITHFFTRLLNMEALLRSKILLHVSM